jgi:hypothetical protein
LAGLAAALDALLVDVVAVLARGREIVQVKEKSPAAFMRNLVMRHCRGLSHTTPLASLAQGLPRQLIAPERLPLAAVI